ncbi:cobaltochelatase CobT-related protein [Bradyrhizobium sp. SZCCHNRI3043]|uniref:cobaltochelatase CobT-related protein n=1 Tax=Bradyrhizobium sp. SZCCHNRI3043 TaxID=3057292 RepID=UPI0028F0EC71|nr:hypothetical protein [Bradyrhizobium sp. SZCCHNRI3043]
MFWRDVFLTAIVALVALSFVSSLRKARRRPVKFDPNRPYRIYTRDFDVEIDADNVDSFLATLSEDERRWAQRFPATDPASLYALERGLARRRSAGKPVRTDADNTVVALLIDHSGSMRGQPMLSAARAALAASDLLSGFGTKHEVLGFTTARWKGGAGSSGGRNTKCFHS